MSEGLLPERVVLISGGTAGLGAGIARAAAREGATVAVTGSVIDWDQNVLGGMD